jgi:hypothetical protein
MKRILLITIFSFLLLKGKAQLSISPNPFSTTAIITYTLANTDSVTLEVVDVTGQIKNKIINDSIISVGTYTISYYPTNLSAGIYFISLITKQGTTVKKFIYQGSATSIQNISIENPTFKIYPNPTGKSINVNYEGLKRIEIIDLNGRIIKTISSSNKNISIEDIKAGEYFINVYFENKLIASEKLFKTE